MSEDYTPVQPDREYLQMDEGPDAKTYDITLVEFVLDAHTETGHDGRTWVILYEGKEWYLSRNHILLRKIGDAKPGDKFRIQCRGRTDTSGGRTVKLFDISAPKSQARNPYTDAQLEAVLTAKVSREIDPEDVADVLDSHNLPFGEN